MTNFQILCNKNKGWN